MPAPSLLRRAIGLGLALFPVAAALAQATPPAGTIRVLVPNTPGSAADITARVVGTRLADDLRQTVVVARWWHFPPPHLHVHAQSRQT